MSLDDKVWAWARKQHGLRCCKPFEKDLSQRRQKKRQAKLQRSILIAEKRRKGRHNEALRVALRSSTS